MTQGQSAFFRRDGVSYAPTGLGLSPWDKRSQSGVSLAGLVALVLETTQTQSPMHTARITIDIMGAVPMAPLTPTVRLLRDGPRMQLVEVELRSGDKTWVRTTALRARISDSPVHAQQLTHPLPQEQAITQRMSWADIVRPSGDFKVRGPGAMWIRLTADVVEGEPLTPLQRMAAVADFGSGTAPLVPYRHWTAANLDIVMNFSRLAQGEWLLVDATSESAGNGIGIANARMGDRDGMFATTAQTLFLNPRVQ